MPNDIDVTSLVAHLPEEECNALATAFIEVWSEPTDSTTNLDPLAPIFDLEKDDPDMLMDLIIEVLRRKPSKRVLNMLAVGPLATFLIKRGESLFVLVEKQAEVDPVFRELLSKSRLDALNDATRQSILELLKST